MRIALLIEYEGSSYFGWQNQNSFPSIQENLEIALRKIAKEKVSTFCGGRTDSGVHAIGQVVHFDTTKNIPYSAWIKGTNSYLPKSIRIKNMLYVNENFHARYSAISRKYHYILYNGPEEFALLRNFVTYYKIPLNEKNMQIASNYLIGEKDFSTFRSRKCQSKSSIRKIYKIRIFRKNNYIIFEIVANSFLYKMVRNIIGSLISVGTGKKKIGWILEILLKKNRNFASFTAPSNGLFLTKINYPKKIFL
ncbi:tRNA pseudouridine(38-40) synthase TruA [bacterium endosymbiont of Pedicinus badii]|uniref:tRNA pseudouridine(38-40) synthase TruA n=1 Tax=bacterium endosymbiont of Pedicinus badii TaxID=1719126 RepID=UPI0009B9E13A|nr:tRNA pseudouridine(38-40) synthase TruA [bacterium endosymbiont of Pedicinus badii]OQM34464.1 hypothetical protein AOQ89_01065 [bacterium endosymbiont of Pedicinus badii]